VPARRPASAARPQAPPASAGPTSPAPHTDAAGSRPDPESPARPIGRRGAPARCRLCPPTPRPGGLLPWASPDPPDAVLAHEPPHRLAVGAELGGHLGQRPPLQQQPVGQVRPQVGEAKLRGSGGEPLVGGVAALAGQPLSWWWQRDPGPGQMALDGPGAHRYRQTPNAGSRLLHRARRVQKLGCHAAAWSYS
jgi:hypothetical protein